MPSSFACGDKRPHGSVVDTFEGVDIYQRHWWLRARAPPTRRRNEERSAVSTLRTMLSFVRMALSVLIAAAAAAARAEDHTFAPWKIVDKIPIRTKWAKDIMVQANALLTADDDAAVRLKPDDEHALPAATSRVVSLCWKTVAQNKTELQSELKDIQAFGVTEVLLFCGFGATPTGGFAVIPNPPQRWGVHAICLEAAALLVQAQVKYTVMAEARLDFKTGLMNVIGDAGHTFAQQALPALASLPGTPGLQLDFERGQDKTIPMPSAAAFATTVGGIAKGLGRGVGVAVSMCPYLSDYSAILGAGAVLVDDMDLYRAKSASDFRQKLGVSMKRLGSANKTRFGAGFSLFPKLNGYENSSAGLKDRLVALNAAGVSRVNVFCWPLLGFKSAASAKLIAEWSAILKAWSHGSDARRALKTDGFSAACSCAGFCNNSCSFGGGGTPQNLTLYRRTARSNLRLADHDTGNLDGDVDFGLYSFTYPLSCHGRAANKTGCALLSNESTTVYASFDVEVDGKFAPYSGCNPVNGTWSCDVHGLQPEIQNTCFAAWHKTPSLCPRLNVSVGKMSTYGACPSTEITDPNMPAWRVWNCELAHLFGNLSDAQWYNTPAKGQCVGSQRIGDGSRCSWRLLGGKASKVVPATTVDDAVANAVMAYSPHRFTACGAQIHNRSSFCWIEAFYDAITGNKTALPRMPLPSISAAWKTAFDSAPPLKGDDEVCAGRSSDAPHCVAHLNDATHVPPWSTRSDGELSLAPNMTCPCAKAPCPNPRCPCVPWSFGCPGYDPAFDLTKVSMAGNFGDNMILQRAPQRSSVFGTATPGANVQLTLTSPAGFSFKAKAAVVSYPQHKEHHGTWKVLLPARKANLRGYTLTLECPGCTNTTGTGAKLVSFGDVWFCSGQSNMEDPVSQSFARNGSFAAADAGVYDRLSLFQTWWRPRVNATYILPAGGPGSSMPRQSKWHSPCGKNCSSAPGAPLKGSLSSFSAACWYTLKGLADSPELKDVPLAAIGSFVGGTYIEQWIQEERQGDCQQTLCSKPPGISAPQKWCYEKGTLYNGHIGACYCGAVPAPPAAAPADASVLPLCCLPAAIWSPFNPP